MCIRDRCYLEQGNYEKARLYFEQHLTLDEELSFKQGIIVALLERSVSYTHLRAHETVLDLVCRLLLEKKKNKQYDLTRIIITLLYNLRELALLD